ncbi:MAG TPA: glycosyl hydrolase family 28-related protein [bacterium]|nr:glycosyl hydrolase family 28-related protein [bacterium]
MRKLVSIWAVWLCIGTAFAGVSDFDVLDFGAVADGVTDNTQAFQKALNRAAEKGGVVHAPAGRYRFDGVLTIPRSVGLQGVAIGPHSLFYDRGTVLMPCAGRDDETSPPFITMESSSILRGLGIVYPEQLPHDIHPYPYCIQTTGRMAGIIDVTIANAYNGIDCGSVNNESHNLRDINICALRRGIYIDRTTDIGRIENVHLHSVAWWDLYYPERREEEIKAINDYTLEHLEGFIIGRCDWEYMVNCFVIWAKVGFRFIETPVDPAGHDPQANILITQSGSDIGPLAVLVEKCQYHVGIAFENCQFFDGVLIEKENQGPVKFTNCVFVGWSEFLHGAHLVNKGRGTVYLTACHFNAKNWIECKWEPDIPFIQILNGALQMMNCRFMDNGNPPDAHIYLGKNVRSSVIIGNSVEGGKLKVTNKSKGEVKILGNVQG